MSTFFKKTSVFTGVLYTHTIEKRMIIMLNTKTLEGALIAVSAARNDSVVVAEAKSDSALDLLHVVAVRSVAALNAAVSADTPTAKAVAAATEQANVAVNNYNAVVYNERLTQWSTMPDAEAYSAYMEDQTVAGLTIKTNDTGAYYLSERPVVVSAYDWIKVRRPEELKGLLDTCVVFADNCARLKVKNTEDAHLITRAVLPAHYAEVRDRLGWDVPEDKLSRTVLKTQLNTLVSRMLPRGVELTMLGSDFRFVYDSLFQTVNKANSAGRYQTRNNETILNYVFRAMYTRYNKLPYEWQQDKSVAKAEEKPATEKPATEKAPAKTAAKKTTVKKTATKKAAATATK